MSTIDGFLAEFKRLSPALVDSYFVVDREKRIVDFNRAFYAMLPRQLARQLKGKNCDDVLSLDIPEKKCVIEQCWESGRNVRLDEIAGRIVGVADASDMRFIVSAMPITNSDGKPIGAVEILRNVTDEAEVQAKYQEMLETEAREKERLATQIRSRTKELLDANRLLLTTQKELLAYKKGLLA